MIFRKPIFLCISWPENPLNIGESVLQYCAQVRVKLRMAFGSSSIPELELNLNEVVNRMQNCNSNWMSGRIIKIVWNSKKFLYCNCKIQLERQSLARRLVGNLKVFSLYCKIDFLKCNYWITIQKNPLKNPLAIKILCGMIPSHLL